MSEGESGECILSVALVLLFAKIQHPVSCTAHHSSSALSQDAIGKEHTHSHHLTMCTQDIEEKLLCVERAVNAVRTSINLHKILKIILHVGNFLNGGTARGQVSVSVRVTQQ